MKPTLLATLLSLAITASTATSAPDAIFLLIGQSNMAGRAKIEAKDQGEIEGAMLWNIGAKKWEPAKAPFNRHSPMGKAASMQRLNPGPSFVRAYQKANPGVSIGIVCAARGGTRIHEWAPVEQNKPTLYDTALTATKAALAGGGTLRGVLWHQGESNSSKAASYPDRLKDLVQNLRNDFNNPKLPVVYSQLGSWRDDYKAFNAMIVQQPAIIPHTACITTEGLGNLDKAHFDTAGQRGLGERFAAAMAKLEK